MRLKKGKKPVADDSSEHEMTPPPEDMEVTEEDAKVFAEEGRKLGNSSAAPEDKPLYGLILTPTRELAVQINDHLKAVAKYTDINIATVFGGLATVKQERMLRKCPEIVIATPGRLWELVKSENHHLSKVTDIRCGFVRNVRKYWSIYGIISCFSDISLSMKQIECWKRDTLRS